MEIRNKPELREGWEQFQDEWMARRAKAKRLRLAAEIAAQITGVSPS